MGESGADKVNKNDRSRRCRTLAFLLTRLPVLNRVFGDCTFLRKGRIEGTNEDPKLLYIPRERPGGGELQCESPGMVVISHTQDGDQDRTPLFLSMKVSKVAFEGLTKNALGSYCVLKYQ